jgi:lipopolysaccharide export system protein LptA
MISRRQRVAAATVAWALWLVAGAAAQGQQGAPNALQGFAVNRDQPVRIEASSLEVRDKSKIAKFLGGVKLTQGEMTMTCKALDVHYEDTKPTQQANAQPPSAQQTSALPGQGGSQQIRLVKALGGVKVTQKDQTATGDSGELDMRTNTVTLIGNVVITQGGNVIRGERVEVDLNSGVSRVLGKKDGRVDLLLNPSTMPGKQGESAKDAPKEQQKKGGPMKLNQAPVPQPRNRVSERTKPEARL